MTVEASALRGPLSGTGVGSTGVGGTAAGASGPWKRDSSCATSVSAATAGIGAAVGAGATATRTAVTVAEAVAIDVLRRRISSHRSPGVDAASTANSPPITGGVNSKWTVPFSWKLSS